MKKFLPDLIAILAFVVISFVYFFPAVTEDRILFQHDTAAGAGADRKPKSITNVPVSVLRWTNSIFGGMPTYQMAPSYDSTDTLKVAEKSIPFILAKLRMAYLYYDAGILHSA